MEEKKNPIQSAKRTRGRDFSLGLAMPPSRHEKEESPNKETEEKKGKDRVSGPIP